MLIACFNAVHVVLPLAASELGWQEATRLFLQKRLPEQCAACRVRTHRRGATLKRNNSNHNLFHAHRGRKPATLVYEIKATPVGFEPTRGDPIGLAGRRLNRSAKVSSAHCEGKA